MEIWNKGKIDLCGSLSHFSPDADVREASLEAEKAYSDFNIEQSMRHDLYTVIHNIYTNADLKSLDPQDERLLSRMERAFRRNGLHLSEDKRQELKALRNRLSDLRIEFNKNYNQESSSEYIYFAFRIGYITSNSLLSQIAIKFTKVWFLLLLWLNRFQRAVM